MPDATKTPSLESQDFSEFAYSWRKVDLLKLYPQSSFQDYLEKKYQTADDAKYHVSFKKGQYLSLEALAIAFLIGAAIFWIAFGLFTKIMNYYRPDQKSMNLRIWSYFASAMHAIMCQLSFIHMVVIGCSVPGNNFATSDACFDQTSAMLQIYFMMSLSYFVSDLITLVPIFGNESKMVRETKIHHWISISALLGGLLIGRWIGIIVANQMFTELSTIFLDVRAVMKELAIDEKYNKCFVINGILLLLSFFLTRVIFLSWFTLFEIVPFMFRYNWSELYKDYGVVLFLFTQILILFYFLLYFMNQVWFYKMQAGARKYINAKKEEPETAPQQNEENNTDDFQRKQDQEEQG